MKQAILVGIVSGTLLIGCGGPADPVDPAPSPAAAESTGEPNAASD